MEWRVGLSSLRTLKKGRLDPLLNILDAAMLGLKKQVKSLTEFLIEFLEHNHPPKQMLRFEILSKDEIESMRSKDWSLAELMDWSDQYEQESPKLGSSDYEFSLDNMFIDEDHLQTNVYEPHLSVADVYSVSSAQFSTNYSLERSMQNLANNESLT